MDNLIKRTRQADPRFLCLFLAAGLQCLPAAFGIFPRYLLNYFTMVPWVLFLGIAWGQSLSPTAKKQLLLGGILALWFAVVQCYHNLMIPDPRSPGSLFTACLLAFPFAVVSGDGKRALGLKIAGGVFLCAALVLTLLTGTLFLGLLLEFLNDHIYWDGARLCAMWHPNITANVFLIAMGFCFYFASSVPQWRRKAVFLALSALFFLLMCLTNSRTAVLNACILTAGAVFFLIWKGGIKRFVLAALAAVAVLLALFSLYQAVFSFHESRMIQQYIQAHPDVTLNIPDLQVNQETGQVSLHTEAVQNSLFQDLATLNSRTAIWKSALKIIGEDPKILIRGTPDIGVLLTAQHSWDIPHAHNSWVETLLGLGLPGLLCALVFTGLGAWHILRLFFFGGHSLPRKLVALLTLCLLISGMLENYLFLASRDYPCANFIFFLCLGYLTQWKEAEA